MIQFLKKINMEDHKVFLALAIPLTISSLATPLLGVVDTAIMGRLPQASYIGGVSIAVLIFNTLYWSLGFLRVSTSGFSAQACGIRDKPSITLSLVRPMIIALLVGMLIIVFQWPIKTVAFALMAPSESVEMIAQDYYNIRIWGAPFTLVNYVISGWLLGMAKVKLSLLLQVFMNMINIVLALVFVLVLGWDAQGVAAATLISEISIAVLGLVVVLKTKMISLGGLNSAVLLEPVALIKMMKVNRDLFIRTICLLTVFNFFAFYGIRYGETVLAANAVLMQLHYVIAYFLSGFANASTVFVGKAIGEKNPELYFKTITITAIWGTLTAIALSLSVILFRQPLIVLFTTLADVQQVSDIYIYWVAAFPLVAVWGLQLYGIFSGATVSVPIRNSMIYSLIVYLVVLWLGVPNLGNHGVWLAFIVFSLGRSLFLWAYLPKLHSRVLHLKARSEVES